jgi:anti-anti-sigma regulatory factor
MDAAAQQQSAAGPSGNLSIDTFIEGSITCLRFQGTIDESFDGKRLASGIKATTLILDMGAVRKISSFGIREWTDFIKSCERSVDVLIAIECTPKVVDQLNMVSQFLGAKGRVFSFYAPYRCDYCDIDRRSLFQVDRDATSIRSLRPSEQLCETCSRPSYFDEEPASFFGYLAQQPPFELSPAIAEFLSSKLRYSVTGGDRRLHIDKHIEGRNTYLKFVGNLDGSFPSGKIAEGLEGTIVVDVSGIGTIDLAGAAEWRNFITQTKSGAERIFLVGCPPVLLERLTRQGDLGDQVISFTMPYSCSKCATTASQVIDVEQHYDILKFATPPEMKCAHCKSATVCVAPEILLSRLRTLPRVEIDSGLRKFIKEMRDRKPVQPQVPKQPGAATGARLGMFTGLIVLALVAAGVLIGVNWYQTREARETQKKIEGVIKKVEDGQDGVVQRNFSRPVWITADTPGSAFCTDNVNRLSCVGVSAYTDSREDGRVEASNAAIEEMANSIGLKIDSATFQDHVRPIYEDARAKALSGLEAVRGTPGVVEYRKARDAVAKSRKAVAEALTATGGAAAPAQQAAWYWEEYVKASGAGNEFLVFVRYDISLSAMKSLMISYSDVIDAGGGAKVVTMFPGIAWDRPAATGGALVIKSSGDLGKLDVPEQAVVTAVDGETVRTAPDMVARLKKAGRSAKLTVVMPDGSVKKLGD